MGLGQKYTQLDMIDISPYLIYEQIEKVMHELEQDYEDIFQSITAKEFKRYIKIRYNL